MTFFYTMHEIFCDVTILKDLVTLVCPGTQIYNKSISYYFERFFRCFYSPIFTVVKLIDLQSSWRRN